MADIFDRDHLPKDEAVQSKLITWIPLHHHAWSSAFLLYGHPFQTLHCRNPTETSRSSLEDSGTLYFNHRRTSNNDVNSITWSVRRKKKKKKNKTKQNRTICKGFQLLWWISHLIWPTKSRGESSAHVIHLVIISLLYLQEEKKKDILYMGFHIDIGLGIIRVLTWAERDLLRPSSW